MEAFVADGRFRGLRFESRDLGPVLRPLHFQQDDPLDEVIGVRFDRARADEDLSQESTPGLNLLCQQLSPLLQACPDETLQVIEIPSDWSVCRSPPVAPAGGPVGPSGSREGSAYRRRQQSPGRADRTRPECRPVPRLVAGLPRLDCPEPARRGLRRGCLPPGAAQRSEDLACRTRATDHASTRLGRLTRAAQRATIPPVMASTTLQRAIWDGHPVFARRP
jgi:hypothetical protein